MAKPEWGVKRTCTSCGARFYDLMKSPIICPKCEAVVEPDVPFKARRSDKKAKAAVAAVAVEAPELEADTEDLEVEEEDAELEDGADDDESGLIEDASDLGGDDDDMAEVIEHIDEDLEDEV